MLSRSILLLAQDVAKGIFNVLLIPLSSELQHASAFTPFNRLQRNASDIGRRAKEMAEELRRAQELIRGKQTSESTPSATESFMQELSDDTVSNHAVCFDLEGATALPEIVTLGSLTLRRDEISDCFKM